MRKLLFFSFFFSFLLSLNSYAQTKKRKVVPIHENQAIYLNGGMNASTMGGKSRGDLIVNLPQNTVEWYFVFRTSPNKSGGTPLKLISQMSRFYDPTGISALAIESINVPNGNGGACDIYTTSNFEHREGFMNKSLSKPSSIFEGTRENFKQGVVKIADKRNCSGTYFICIKNPSTMTGVNVDIEVGAIVEYIDFSTWNDEMIRKVHPQLTKNILNQSNLNLTEIEASKIATCALDKMKSEKTPQMFAKLSEKELDVYLTGLAQSCGENLQVLDNSEDAKSKTYSKLSYQKYMQKDLDKAIEYGEKALSLSNNFQNNAVLGLLYFAKNNEAKSLEYYVEAIQFTKKMTTEKKKRLLSSAIQRIKNAPNIYPDIKEDSKKTILDLLSSE